MWVRVGSGGRARVGSCGRLLWARVGSVVVLVSARVVVLVYACGNVAPERWSGGGGAKERQP